MTRRWLQALLGLALATAPGCTQGALVDAPSGGTSDSGAAGDDAALPGLDAGARDSGSSFRDAATAGRDAATAAGTDAGEDAREDAATPPADGGALADAGLPGSDAGDAGGAPDAATVNLPTTAGWQFYGPAQGGPQTVVQVSADEGGNLWVAGGEEGLFLLAAGSTTLRRFTMAEGLRPYGFLPDGTAPVGDKFLKVISVAGGPAGTVYVGYEGKNAGKADSCESNWDSKNPDPNIYKSGDADRVMLNSTGGINVVHYDIFSGPNIVRDEPRGREKLCSILRIVWDRNTHSVWFGGNHGFARGDSTYPGNPTCNGALGCSGVLEHVHPAINGWQTDARAYAVLLTDGYYGVAADPSGDVWFGGTNRTTRFKYVSANGYWNAAVITEQRNDWSDRFDVWPDAVGEPDFPTPSQRKDDAVSAIAAMGDGSVWVASFNWGLAHLSSGGALLGRLDKGSGLLDDHVPSLKADPLDGSLWVGAGWGGLTRMKNGAKVYGEAVFGTDLFQQPVVDIQSAGAGSHRRMLVAFRGGHGTAGAIGVYSGP